MQTRELIILLLLILVVAVVIALVMRRANAKRADEDQQMGSQAAWLESADEPRAAASGDASTPSVAADEGEAVPMTRAERREAREAAEATEATEGVQPEPVAEPEPASVAEGDGDAGAGWVGVAPDTDPDAERIATAAGFRDEVAAGDALSEDIEIPANEWGGPREDVPDEEPTVENPVEDDLPQDAPDPSVEEVAVVEEPTVEDVEEPTVEDVEEPTADHVEEPTVENPVEDDLRPDAPEHTGRRISGFLELRDGGFGVGSAAPIEDGAQPLDHPVKAYRDTMTFRAPGDPGYDSAEPDVWFYDGGAAERSGFRPAAG